MLSVDLCKNAIGYCLKDNNGVCFDRCGFYGYKPCPIQLIIDIGLAQKVI